MAHSPLRAPSVWTAVLAVLAGAAAACSGVLGLDAPTLAPCGGECPDSSVATTDGATIVVGNDAGSRDAGEHDSAPEPDDSGPVVVSKTDSGLRCGSAASDLYCSKGVCCLTTDDAGDDPTYTCEDSTSDCPGFPIGCATYNDCTGSDVCCLYASSMKCEGETTCGNTSIVCDPTGPTDQCPTGWKCDLAIARDGTTLPYYNCSQ